MIERIILAGGGTGGHLFPGIAVFEELRRREPDLEALFVGTARGIETKVIPQLGERLVLPRCRPLEGPHQDRVRARTWWVLPQAGVEAAKLLRSFRPNLVLGMGGYAAGPMVRGGGAARHPHGAARAERPRGPHQSPARAPRGPRLSELRRDPALLPEWARSRGGQSRSGAASWA